MPFSSGIAVFSEKVLKALKKLVKTNHCVLFPPTVGGEPGTKVISLDSKGFIVTVKVGISKVGGEEP